MKRLFMGNKSLKIASVIVAIGLWFFINSKGMSEITVTVPLEIRNLQAGHEIVANRANQVRIGIRGHERLIKGIGLRDIRAFLDLSRPKDGWGVYYLNKDNIRVPPSIEVTKIDPSAIKLQVEKTVSREIPVRVIFRGRPKTGFTVKSVIIKPQSVYVEGARSILDKIKAFGTEEIDLSGRSAPFEQDTGIITDGENVRTNTDTARVRVVITRRGK